MEKHSNENIKTIFGPYPAASVDGVDEIALYGAGQKPSPVKKSLELLKRSFHFSDIRQKKAMGYILRFLALMLVFTVIARGTSGAALARVELCAAYSSEIIKSITIYGIVEAAQPSYVRFPKMLSVKAALAAPGQYVKPGDPLLKFDLNEIEESKKRAALEYDELALEYNRLLRNEAHDGTMLAGASDALKWAQDDLLGVKAKGQDMINDAENNLNNAKTALASKQAAYDLLMSAQDTGEEEINAAALELDMAKKEAEAVEKALSEAKNSAGEMEKSAQRSIETAKRGLSSAKIADSEQRRAKEDTKQANLLAAEKIKLDMADKKKAIDLFDNISEDGVFYSPIEGTIIGIPVAGDATGQDISIAAADGGFQALGRISKKDAEMLAPGSTADIEQGGGYFDTGTAGTAKLISCSPAGDDGMAEAVYKLPEGKWEHGQQISLEAVQSRNSYDSCVPLSAVRQDNKGSYVLLMESKSGILGVENVLRSVPVQLIADDGKTAAVKGDIGYERNIVVSSSKAISHGDKVRVS